MRIGLASTHMWSETAFRNAGISKSSYRLIDALSTKYSTDTITVFANTEFETGKEWAERKNLKVHSTVPVGRGKRALWEFLGSAQEIRKGDFDVWFATSHIVPRKSHVPTAAIIHDMIPLIYPEFQDWSQSAYLRFALIHVAKKADLVITNSEQTKADIVRFAKVTPTKIVVVPFGPGAKLVARPRQEICPEELSEIPFQRFFFSLGTLEPRKNLNRLFEALALLSQPECRDVGLVIGGGRGWQEDGIFTTLKGLGIEDRVKFLGYVPDDRLPTLFAASEGFAFPSVYEGFGMPLVESMQLGTIVLTSHSGAMREVVGDAAIMFEPTDSADIANAMKRCLALNQEERAQLSQAGIVQASQFNWERSAEKTREALAELLNRR